MCLALPAEIVEINESEQTGTVELHGNRYPANFVLVPEVKLGDWVLVHAGYAIKTVSPEDARETWELIDQALGQNGSDAGY